MKSFMVCAAIALETAVGLAPAKAAQELACDPSQCVLFRGPGYYLENRDYNLMMDSTGEMSDGALAGPFSNKATCDQLLNSAITTYIPQSQQQEAYKQTFCYLEKCDPMASSCN